MQTGADFVAQMCKIQTLGYLLTHLQRCYMSNEVPRNIDAFMCTSVSYSSFHWSRKLPEFCSDFVFMNDTVEQLHNSATVCIEKKDNRHVINGCALQCIFYKDK